MTGQTQFCFKCHEPVDSDEHLARCMGQTLATMAVEDPPAGDPAPEEIRVGGEEEGPEEVGSVLEVITGFTVVLGRAGRPMVLPLHLGATIVADRTPDSADIQAACREISDDLLAHRAAEYSETPAQMGAVADILGELAVRIEKAEQ